MDKVLTGEWESTEEEASLADKMKEQKKNKPVVNMQGSKFGELKASGTFHRADTKA